MTISIPSLQKTEKQFLFRIVVLFMVFCINGSLEAQSSKDSSTIAIDSLIWNSPATTFNNSPWKNAGVVKNDEKRSIPYETPEQLFAGRVAGVQVMETNGSPGGEFSVRVRGTSSLVRSSEPLYVIDGFPLEFFSDNFGYSTFEESTNGKSTNALSMVNPADIESIQVVKNASALAIYGSRGLNGVVIINTKRGLGRGLKINYETSYSVQKMTRNTKVLTTAEYIARNNNLASDYPALAFRELKDPLSSYPVVNWMDEVTRVGSIQKHQLDLSGGIDHLRFSIHGGLYNHNGIVKQSGFLRKSIRVNIDADFWKHRIQVGTNFYYADANVEMKSIRKLQESTPIGPVYNPDGSFYKLAIGGRQIENPIETIFAPDTRRTMDRMIFNSYLKFKILDNLFITSRYAASFSTQNFSFKPLTNTNIDLSYGVLNEKYFENNVSFIQSIGVGTFRLTGSYINQNFKDHRALVSGSENIAKPYFQDLKNIGYGRTDTIPGTPLQISQSGWGKSSPRQQSAYLQSGFDIGSKISLNANFRKDFFMTELGVPSRDSFGAGAVWILKNGRTDKDEKLSSLKLYLDAGQLAQFNYAIRLYPVGQDFRVKHSKEEKKRYRKTNRKNLSIGGEIGLLGDRILIDLELFNQVSRDVLPNLVVSVPVESGGASTLSTVDKVISKGVEFNVRTLFFNTGKFKWSSSFNASLLANTVENRESLYSSSGADLIVNKRIGSWALLRSQGVWNSEQEIREEYKGSLGQQPEPGDARYADANGDGYIGAGDPVFRGSANPNFLWGFSSEVSWGSLDLSLLIRGESGQKIMNTMGYGLSREAQFDNVLQSVLKERWSPDNPTGSYQKYASREERRIVDSDWFLQKGSFIRLQSLSFGYTLPLFSQKHNVRFYLSGQNLFLITKYKGWDPEVNSNGQDAFLRGTDTGAYPRARTFTVGMQVHL